MIFDIFHNHIDYFLYLYTETLNCFVYVFINNSTCAFSFGKFWRAALLIAFPFFRLMHELIVLGNRKNVCQKFA